MTYFREIAPGVFARDIEQGETRSGVTSRARRFVQNAAVNEVSPLRAQTGREQNLGELIETALQVATTIGDARAHVERSLREARALFGDQLREAERAINRASRRVR